MEDQHLVHAVRYALRDLVRAKLVKCAADWPWSSVAVHLAGQDDGLVKIRPVLKRYGDFPSFLV